MILYDQYNQCMYTLLPAILATNNYRCSNDFLTQRHQHPADWRSFRSKVSTTEVSRRPTPLLPPIVNYVNYVLLPGIFIH